MVLVDWIVICLLGLILALVVSVHHGQQKVADRHMAAGKRRAAERDGG